MRPTSRPSIHLLGILSVLVSGFAQAAAQTNNRFHDLGLGTRVEVYLLPELSSGPVTPAWSPDGRWLAFAMRGDVWKVPVEGGVAQALTSGPHSHFEPAWSPDGQSLALTVDTGHGYRIGRVSAQGGDVELLSGSPSQISVDVQPAWHPNGRHIYFSSARDRTLNLYRLDVSTGDTESVLQGSGQWIQPQPSPDGRRLAYVAPVAGFPGSGGVHLLDLETGESRLVFVEETSYRTWPRWTPDGSALVLVTDRGGSHDIALVSQRGGAAVRLTEHPDGEFNPVVSPDGNQIAFISNREGVHRLFTMPAGGGQAGRWAEVEIRERQARVPTGSLRIHAVVDGEVMPVRVHLTASDGRSYAPDEHFIKVASRTETHFFHIPGEAVVELPAGPATLEVFKGFEYAPATVEVDVPAGGEVLAHLELERIVDPAAFGWISGDTHGHDLHIGNLGLDHARYALQVQGEDVGVMFPLIHMDGTKIQGRWGDLTGEPHPLSTPRNIIQYSQEFRGPAGHVGLVGVGEFVVPLSAGEGGTPYPVDVLNTDYLAAARAQGGVGGFMHPYSGGPIREPQDAATSSIPVDLALGQGDFYDIVGVWADSEPSTDMYYRFMNVGFHLAATGGTDSFSDVWRDPPVGTGRTYALTGEGPVRPSAPEFMEAIREGKTFGTNGPLLFMDVAGEPPGSVMEVSELPGGTVPVSVEVASIVPLDVVEIVSDGRVVHSEDARGRGPRFTVEAEISVADAGWIAARARGPNHPHVADDYPFAHTTPVYLTRNGLQKVYADDAVFLYRVVEELWEWVDGRDRWRNEDERATYQSRIQAALDHYQEVVEAAR